MGLFSKVQSLAGGVPRGPLENGLLGRGIIASVQQTSVTTGEGANMSYVCVFTVEVTLDNTPRYTASCRQAVRAPLLPQLMTPGTTVAVRVDPSDHAKIALSLSEEPPTVTMAANDGGTRSAADILEQGDACRVVIVETLPLGVRSPRTGDDVYAFTLTVMADGKPPYRIDVGNPVPKAAVPLLYPGSTLPAKRIPDGDERELAIDWTAALGQAEAVR
jgi:hypothetical protein